MKPVEITRTDIDNTETLCSYLTFDSILHEKEVLHVNSFTTKTQ